MVDVETSVSEMAEGEEKAPAAFAKKTFAMRSEIVGPQTIVSAAEAFPGAMDVPHRSRRLFNDWQFSSAGRSGGRLWGHWALNLSSDTDT